MRIRIDEGKVYLTMRRWILVLVLLLFAVTPAHGRTAPQKKARTQTPAPQAQAKEAGDQEEPYKALYRYGGEHRKDS